MVYVYNIILLAILDGTVNKCLLQKLRRKRGIFKTGIINSYIELCNPFSRVVIRSRSLNLNNSFFRIVIAIREYGFLIDSQSERMNK